MANVTHKNPNFHISKPSHKLNTNKQIVPKNKLSKKLSPKFKTKMMNPSFSNKALKVVHISNPMKYKATVAEFRTLVQGLTGRDAVIDWPNEPAHGSDHNQCKTDGNISVNDGGNYGVYEQVDNQDHDHDHHDFKEGDCFGPSDLSYDYFGNFPSDVDDHDHDMELESLRAFYG